MAGDIPISQNCERVDVVGVYNLRTSVWSAPAAAVRNHAGQHVQLSRGKMRWPFLIEKHVRYGAVLAVVLTSPVAAQPDNGFPFGLEMTLDVARQPGSKRLPTLEIGDNGETVVELWCKGGQGQFSVAGNTVIFMPGPLEDRACPAARAQADDDLVAALSQASTWQRQGDLVSFMGARTLRFRLNTN